MWKVLTPKKIAFGENADKDFEYPDNSLIITTTTPDIYNKWLDYMGVKNYEIYDKVTPDPAIETVESIKKELKEILDIQLHDNVKARWLDNELDNKYVRTDGEKIRSQVETYNYLKNKIEVPVEVGSD